MPKVNPKDRPMDAPIWVDYYKAADETLFKAGRQKIERALSQATRSEYHAVMTQVEAMSREAAAAIADALTGR